ncbi:imelysin family protein [Bacterioplanoides sp.]|uniref:imelysin family protein n=1 Tax=Bacterioplanoides sp. TaxID=2066072 RepID=UPI003B00EB3F
MNMAAFKQRASAKVVRVLMLSVSSLLMLTACDSAPSDDVLQLKSEQHTETSDRPLSSSTDLSAFRAYVGLSAYTSLATAAEKALQLDQRLSTFLQHPDATHLVQVQSAWRDAYDAYLATLVYAYIPVNDPAEWRQKGIDYRTTRALLDSWPIEGGYIDHVPGYPFSGIVNDLTLELTEVTLQDQHGFSDPSYASLGYHPLEFMLWGANGDRDPADFAARDNSAPVVMPSEGRIQETDSAQATHDAAQMHSQHQVQNHKRRRQYVQLLSNQLMEHLQRLVRRWEPSNGYYSGLLEQTSDSQATLAALVAGQTLISFEILDRRLGTNSSEFSNTGIDDVIAATNGLKGLLLGQEQSAVKRSVNQGLVDQGLVNQLPNSELSEEWQQQFATLDQQLQQWQEQGLASPELSEQIRSQFIVLLSLLEQTADALSMRLPRLEELSRY